MKKLLWGLVLGLLLMLNLGSSVQATTVQSVETRVRFYTTSRVEQQRINQNNDAHVIPSGFVAYQLPAKAAQPESVLGWLRQSHVETLPQTGERLALIQTLVGGLLLIIAALLAGLRQLLKSEVNGHAET
ncbi:LPXTG cell wall anchor domain-containing protein [Lactiplantibacillus modestisalitolerans]|uniref:LPXTG cell wall anchor domain-containing protein n=1 Tax=Lactiplantibacillus modestisalitolerans TaxID=1457219 RepID=A0ABV5WRA6_9LACO|nr:LPXTG cell wall anchor domain-containing protein [Lactiplantibacillus modestisalitolerans]